MMTRTPSLPAFVLQMPLCPRIFALVQWAQMHLDPFKSRVALDTGNTMVLNAAEVNAGMEILRTLFDSLLGPGGLLLSNMAAWQYLNLHSDSTRVLELGFFECRVKARLQGHPDQCCDQDCGVELPNERFRNRQRSRDAMDRIHVAK